MISRELYPVVSHLFTGSLASISKLPVLAGWYLVWYVRYFLYCKIWRELHFVKFCGNSPQKGGLIHQKGGRSKGKRGSPQMYDTEGPYRVFLGYGLGNYRENTNRYHTEIPNRDTTLMISNFETACLRQKFDIRDGQKQFGWREKENRNRAFFFAVVQFVLQLCHVFCSCGFSFEDVLKLCTIPTYSSADVQMK
jgi:hypothetical protein